MDIQTTTANWLADRLNINPTNGSSGVGSTPGGNNINSNEVSSYSAISPVIAIADKLSDTASAISLVALRQGSLDQLGNYLEQIQSKVLELDSVSSSSYSDTLIEEISQIEKDMSVFIAENMISDASGSIQQRNIPDSGFARFVQVLNTQSADGAEGFLATIEVDMATVLSHAHSPVSCPICEQQAAASPEDLSTTDTSSSVTAIFEDAATTNTTNSTGATATTTSSDGYVEAITHDYQWDLSEGEKISYSFYNATVPYDPNYGAVWPDNASPLNAQQQEDMREVYALWDAAAAFEFEEITETGPDNIGELRVAYMIDPTLRPTAAAFAYIPNNGTSGGDAWYVTNGVQDSGGGYSYNLDFTQGYGRLVALHEIGHSIGLSHPHDESSATGATYADYGIQDDTNTTVMSYTDAPDYAFYNDNGSLAWNQIYASTPMVYDVAAMEYLYGDITDTNAGDTTYTITDRAYIQTLVDVGGTDTIDVSSVSYRSIIDLTPGSFNDAGYATEDEQNTYLASQGVSGAVFGGASRLFTGTDNLGIAFSATIENIIGSAGDDEFTGNSSNNVIKGNAGDDQINGGGGTANYAVFNGSFSDYTITDLGSGSYSVTDTNTSDGNDGTDTLSNIQYFEFADVTYNPTADRSVSTSGGALAGQSVAPKALASSISIAPSKKSAEDGGFKPFSAAHSVAGINLATAEGREEALILLEIGLSSVRGQASRLEGLESELGSSFTLNLTNLTESATPPEQISVEMQIAAEALTRNKAGLIQTVNLESKDTKALLESVLQNT